MKKKEEPLFECFEEENWEEIKEEKKCVICGNKLNDTTNPIGNAHYDCWINLPYY